MAVARWSSAALFIVAGGILGFTIAVVLITMTWGGFLAAVPCSDEETNPASLCRNGLYAHGLTGWLALLIGVVAAVVVGVVGGIVSRVGYRVSQSPERSRT